MDKICVIANGFQEQYIMCVVNAFANEGVEVDFIGSDIYSHYEMPEKVNFLNLRGSHDENVSRSEKIKRLISYYRRIAKYYRKSNVKVVHLQWFRFAFFESLYFYILGKLFGKKNMYTVHNVYAHDKENFKSKVFLWILYRTFTKLFAHTDFIKKRLINEFNIKPEKIKVFKHGLYDTIINDNHNTALNVDRNEVNFLFFGYIAYYKGLHLLLEAFSNMKDVPNITLNVAGKVEGQYANDLEALTNKLKEDSRITFSIGYVPDDEAHKLMSKASVIMLPYIEASQSGVLLMAYTYAKPVIVSRLGGFPDDVVEGKTGYLFEPNNVSDLEKTMRTFVEEWRNGSMHSEYIREYSQEKYSWSKSAQTLIKAYQEQ